MNIQTRLLSSMEKCFLDEKIENKREITVLSMLKNERLSFQLAYIGETARQNVKLTVTGGLTPYILPRYVEYVPVSVPAFASDDPNYLRREPGLYPDLLLPTTLADLDKSFIVKNTLHTILFTVENPEGIPAGDYELAFTVTAGEETDTKILKITVVNAMLPEQTLIHTQWFHNDCIATYYGVDVFSERHWELIGNYMRAAVRCGVTMILTPVLTPPLDTAVGHERPTVQLVDIEVTDEGYRFGYEKLDRYVGLAKEAGIRYFEISHLFSQWGAIHAPKVMAKVNGEMKRIFGWDTEATGEEYKTFIRAFVAKLIEHLKELGIDKQCRFHISDEPNISQLETYTAAKQLIADLIADYPQMDALSSFEFYETGAVGCPVPAINHIVPFLENKVPNLWAYFCCGQHYQVSNRFMSMPGARTRILGEQLYKFDIKGFLQWGFNFWYSQGSLRPINPFTEVCGDYWVPAGDTMSVYPGGDGKAIESLHAVLFYEALQDQRAFQLLETKIGRSAAVALIDYGCAVPMTFTAYPQGEEYILKLRNVVNQLVSL